MFKNKFGNIFALTATLTMMSSVCLSTLAQAEILVILPETGTMANASDSIRRGLVQANHNADEKYTFNSLILLAV